MAPLNGQIYLSALILTVCCFTHTPVQAAYCDLQGRQDVAQCYSTEYNAVISDPVDIERICSTLERGMAALEQCVKEIAEKCDEEFQKTTLETLENFRANTSSSMCEDSGNYCVSKIFEDYSMCFMVFTSIDAAMAETENLNQMCSVIGIATATVEVCVEELLGICDADVNKILLNGLDTLKSNISAIAPCDGEQPEYCNEEIFQDLTDCLEVFGANIHKAMEDAEDLEAVCSAIGIGTADAEICVYDLLAQGACNEFTNNILLEGLEELKANVSSYVTCDGDLSYCNVEIFTDYAGCLEDFADEFTAAAMDFTDMDHLCRVLNTSAAKVEGCVDGLVGVCDAYVDEIMLEGMEMFRHNLSSVSCQQDSYCLSQIYQDYTTCFEAFTEDYSVAVTGSLDLGFICSALKEHTDTLEECLVDLMVGGQCDDDVYMLLWQGFDMFKYNTSGMCEGLVPDSGEDACGIYSCWNGGTCHPNPGSWRGYRCDCGTGYTGETCEIKSWDSCDSSVCLNGGTCKTYTDEGNFWCDCSDGYWGTYCETGPDSGEVCGMFSCLNGGSCYPDPGSWRGYTCDCPQPYVGEACEIQGIYSCDSSTCGNGGTCKPQSDGTGSWCDCRSGYWGTYCEDGGSEVCGMAPCLNGGSCDEGIAGGAMCKCPDGFHGLRCEFDKYGGTNRGMCESNPCQNGGICISRGSWDYSCQCPPGRGEYDCSYEYPRPGRDACNETAIRGNISDCVSGAEKILEAASTSAISLSEMCSQVANMTAALKMCVDGAFWDSNCDDDFIGIWKQASDPYLRKFDDLAQKCEGLKKPECQGIDQTTYACVMEEVLEDPTEEYSYGRMCGQYTSFTRCAEDSTESCPELADLYLSNITRLLRTGTDLGCTFRVGGETVKSTKDCNLLQAFNCINPWLDEIDSPPIDADTSFSTIKAFNGILSNFECDKFEKVDFESIQKCIWENIRDCEMGDKDVGEDDWDTDADWESKEDGDNGGEWNSGTASATAGSSFPEGGDGTDGDWGDEEDWDTEKSNSDDFMPDIRELYATLDYRRKVCSEDCPDMAEIYLRYDRLGECMAKLPGGLQVIKDVLDNFNGGKNNRDACQQLYGYSECVEDVSDGCGAVEDEIAKPSLAMPETWQLKGICDFKTGIDIKNPIFECPSNEAVKAKVDRCKGYGQQILSSSYMSTSDACKLIQKEVSCIHEITGGCLDLIREYVVPVIYDWILTADAIGCSAYGVDVSYIGVSLKFMDSEKCSFYRLSQCYANVYDRMNIRPDEPGHPTPLAYFNRWLNVSSGLFHKNDQYCSYFEGDPKPNYDEMSRCARNMKDECMPKIPLIVGLPGNNLTPKPRYSPFDMERVQGLVQDMCNPKCKDIETRGEAIKNCSGTAYARTAFGLEGLGDKIMGNEQRGNTNRETCKSLKNVTQCLHQQVDGCPYLIDSVEGSFEDNTILSGALEACAITLDLSAQAPATEPPGGTDAGSINIPVLGILLAAILVHLM